MVKLVRHDLEFILKQIEIAEAHAAGADITDLVITPHLPYGLRTVDGSYNNIVPGREHWGAADQPFPNLLEPEYLNENDGDYLSFGMVDTNRDGIPDTEIRYTNTDYAVSGNGTHVIDADPRIISNLIVDQSAANPAALAAMDENSFRFDHDNNDATPDLVFIPNVAPDEGLSSPFNGWMTIFGQFFDHGLDLVGKGNSGTVYVPLQPDDPLYVEGSHTNFMVLTRATVDPGADGRLGTEDDGTGPVNSTTPWVDQNQTYGSHASKQVFMREYAAGPNGKPVATGLLLEGNGGANGSKQGMATWADVKQQAADVLGIKLTDLDVGKIPLIAADQYGNFIPGPNGYPQLVVGLGADGILGTNPATGLNDDVLVEGDPANPIDPSAVVLSDGSVVQALRTGHAFLDDIAHNAVPVVSGGALQPDTDTVAGTGEGSIPIPVGSRGQNLQYDNELLDAHYIAGDGRANENIALTAVHHIFHGEHNRLVEHTKEVVLEANDLAFLNEWLLVPVTEVPTTQEAIDALVWNGERLFQAGRFVTEMEYQHLVFEEFARKMQPDIDAFVFNSSTDIDPAIMAEFAHVVYRFGHSMLTEEVARINIGPDGAPVDDSIGLIDAFLNPIAFAEGGTANEAAGAIVRGMSRQVGNEIDEFVTGALRNNLLGLPLDLATINIARGRDTGMATLNEARKQFFEATADTQLKPYESWVDFAVNLKNPASIINFIAAYGTHESITGVDTVAEKRAAATLLVMGDMDLDGDGVVEYAPDDRADFLNGTGTWANLESGLNKVDFWIGGLAEKKMPFGGMLGSTFAFVFEATLENLQNGDRFYYLTRVQGLNLLNELENNSFAKLAMRNTDLGEEGQTALPGDLFSAVAIMLEMDQSKQIGGDPEHDDPVLQALSPMVVRKDTDGDGVADYIAYQGADHIVVGGTEGADTIVAGGGDDAVWAKGGNDRIEAGYGVDKVHGGAGDDIITNSGTDIGETDFLHGEEGNDVIHGGSGLALLFGNEGKDVLITGPDGKEVFGGTGDDFILGGEGVDFLLGNEGDDWIEAGNGFDTTAGDNSELFFNSTIIGHDVMFAGEDEHDFDAESGDDIMVQGESVMRNEGMFGFDWAIHKGNRLDGDSDLTKPIFTTDQEDILRDRFDQVEALSGWKNNDVLRGDNRVTPAAEEVPEEGEVVVPDLAGAENTMVGQGLSQAGVDRINGLRELLGLDPYTGPAAQAESVIAYDAGNVLIGGGGSDLIEGRGGDDIIDGDAWLNVRVSVRQNADGTGPELYTVDSLKDTVDFNGQPRTLISLLVAGEVNPGQLKIVREILDGGQAGDVDTAVFSDVFANYSIAIDRNGTLEDNSDDIITVTHLNGGVDGTDRVRNVETFRFASGDVSVRSLLNRAPTASGQVNLGQLAANTVLVITAAQLLEGASDIDGDALTIQNLTASSGTVVSNGNGTWSFTPLQGDGTEVTFSYQVSDGIVSTPQTAFLDLLPPPVTDQTFTGNDTAESINTGDGDDVVFALGGDDTITTNGGNDEVEAGTGNDTVSGGVGHDTILGGAGNDTLFGNEGDDILNGDDGVDNIFGGAGDDIITGGRDADTLYGGAGNDTFVATAGDGSDTYYGDDALDGNGNDTLDMSGITSPVTVDLNPGLLGNGRASSVQTGLDTLWNIENVITGSGNDSIIASNAVNIMDGGAGSDSFRFRSVAAADGDRIVGFETGDRIDLALIDADATNGGNHAFTLVTGAAFTAVAQIMVTHETRADGAFTIVQGNVNEDLNADFRIELTGTHNLTASDFAL